MRMLNGTFLMQRAWLRRSCLREAAYLDECASRELCEPERSVSMTAVLEATPAELTYAVLDS